ncbi:MAG TPA: 30S ribosomal protein S7 [Firmicutes bacterium]|nr:30S ribosomal protein S7 [Bacillota bacterium]
MPRRGATPKREIIPDPIYNDPMITQFINKITYSGERGIGEKILYQALDIVKEKTGKDALEVFQQAMKNVMPVLEVKPRRVGGATYQVPVEVRPERRVSLAMRWLIFSARARSERTMSEKLAAELMDAANNVGTAIKKKEDTHRMAEANKAFAHYRW